jgi:hypothetical protein
MKKLLLLLFFLPNLAFSEIIAVCENPEGHAYYPFSGLMNKADSGWTKDKITGGITQLVQDNSGKFDILVLDASKTIYSSTQDGGVVLPFAYDNNQVSVMVVFMGETVETYSFIKDNSGNIEFLMTQNKAAGIIPKITAFRGECSYLDLSKVRPD